MENKLTWRQYLNRCNRLTPKGWCFPMLVHSIPFEVAYKHNVHPKSLMGYINKIVKMKMTIDERLSAITEFISEENHGK